MANAILLVGIFDPLAFRIENVARLAGISCTHLRGEDFIQTDAAKMGDRLEDCYVSINGRRIYPINYSGILNGYTCRLALDITREQLISHDMALERYWAEWNAFLGSIFSEHPNVINPPFNGASNGHQPSIFWQVNVIKHIRRISFPTISQLAIQAVNVGHGSFHNLYSVSDMLIPGLTASAEGSVEISHIYLSFIDEEIVCNIELPDPDLITVREVISELRATFATRLGQITLTRFGRLLYFRAFSTRPTLTAYSWNKQLIIITRILETLCGRDTGEIIKYFNHRGGP